MSVLKMSALAGTHLVWAGAAFAQTPSRYEVPAATTNLIVLATAAVALAAILIALALRRRAAGPPNG